ncbi:response regulator [Delftia sp. PS-11]|uniref:response regulator n=1 Tax=Delftia sp. PS-11 TaxID=2767222 RepID=UPI003AB569B8
MIDRSSLFQPSTSLILIAEDAPDIADILCAYLARSGFRTAHAADGAQAIALHQSLKPDLVLLDVQMPRHDGWQVLSEIRHRGDTPVIMLTALDQDMDKLVGLRMGADDYVAKPFNAAEVVARVQAVLRRAGQVRSREARPLQAGPFRVDLESREVAIQIDGAVHVPELTATEFNLLACFVRSPRRVFSRAELLLGCLPEGHTLERTVDSHISKLRKKLESLGLQGMPLGVRSLGYRLGLEP